MTKQKTNKEITIEELKKIHGEYMVAKALATISGEYYENEDEWKNNFFEPFAEILLLKLHLEEGVVIAEGEVISEKDATLWDIFQRKQVWIGDKNLDESIRENLREFKGKKGKLIFIEDNK